MPRRLVVALALITLAAAGLAAFAFGAGGETATARSAQARFGTVPLRARISGNVAQVLLSPSSIATLQSADARLARLPGVAAVQSPASYLSGTVSATQSLLGAVVGVGPWARAQRRAAQEAAALTAHGASAATAAAGAEEERVLSLGHRLGATYTSTLIRLGLDTYPTLADQDFLDATVFGTGQTPKASVRWLIPSAQSALVLVSPRAGASAAQRRSIAGALSAALTPLGADTGDSVSVMGDTASEPTLTFAISGADLLQRADLRWLTRADARIASALPGAALAPNLGNLFGSVPSSEALARRLFAQLPASLTANAMSADRRVGEIAVTLPPGASVSAGAGAVRAALDGAPAGVDVAPVGALSVSASHDRWPLARIVLVAVAVLALALLIAVWRRPGDTEAVLATLARRLSPGPAWRRRGVIKLQGMGTDPGHPRHASLARAESRR